MSRATTPSRHELAQQFIAMGQTLRNEHRDFSAWHRGRRWFMLWALDVDTPLLRQRVRALQRLLRGRLLSAYHRQPHVTVALCGFPTTADTESAPGEDEFSLLQLQHQLKSLGDDPPGAFEIEVNSLASFGSAPFLNVQPLPPQDGLTKLRQHLAHSPLDRQQEIYVPHVTLGLYRAAWSSSMLSQCFTMWRQPAALRLSISQIWLMAYASSNVGGLLRKLLAVDLESGNVVTQMALTDFWPGLASGMSKGKRQGLLRQR